MSTTHFLTQSLDEAKAAMANMGATAEGTPFWALSQRADQFVPMYRLNHAARKTHLFTTAIDERDAAVNEEGYWGEGIGFWCFAADQPPSSDTQPVFRLYNSKTDDHFYTIDKHETASGYRREGTACQVFNTQQPGTDPLHRVLTPSGSHFYTSSAAEFAGLMAQPAPNKYTDEGILGFVFTAITDGPQPLFRSYNPNTGGHLYTTDVAEYDASSRNSGYRGDGVSCFIGQPADTAFGGTKLLRAYNPGLDDHFYTIDPTEHANAINQLGYVEETFAGWVFTSFEGQFTAMAVPMFRFLGDFSTDHFLVPPSSSFLSSSSNFFMASIIGGSVNPVLGLDIEMEVQSDITVESVDFGTLGFGFQLNCWSPPFYTSAFQQFGIMFYGGELVCEVQNWADSPFAIGFIAGQKTLCHIGGNTLTAGHRLRIVQINDEFSNVVGAEFYAYKGTHEIAHHTLLVKNFEHAGIFGAAPIVAAQQVLVGPFDAETATVAAGAKAQLTYKAAVPLMAITSILDIVEDPGIGTGEESNVVYGEMASTKSKLLTQSLGVSAVPLRLMSRPPKRKRTRRPGS
jgi:Repeat of unknown function (DUF5648)